MAILGLLVLKFFLYYGVVMLAPKYLNVAPTDRFAFSIAWAAARLGLGLFFGYLIFVVIGFLQGTGMPSVPVYLAVMLVSRYLLWLLTASLISLRHTSHGKSKQQLWVLLGICASFAIDGVALLAGADNFKFFC